MRDLRDDEQVVLVFETLVQSAVSSLTRKKVNHSNSVQLHG